MTTRSHSTLRDLAPRVFGRRAARSTAGRLARPAAGTLAAALLGAALALPVAADPMDDEPPESPPPPPPPPSALVPNPDVIPANASAPRTSSPPPVAAGGETPAADPLDDYLESLTSRHEDEFDLQALSISDAEVDSLIRDWEMSGESPYDPPPPTWHFEPDLAAFRYNRVEGANVMPGARIGLPLARGVEVFGRGGYGWANGEWTARAGARAELLRSAGRPTLEFVWARDVYSFGDDGHPTNTIAASMFGRDYQDYFRGEGWGLTLAAAHRRFSADIGWRVEDQESMAKETDWSLFERAADFRANPAIDEGTMRAVEGRIGWGDPSYDRFAADVSVTKGGDAIGGDFDFESMRATVTGRRSPWLGDIATLALSGGVVTGDAPWQSLGHLGGFSTLRGYEPNERPARQWTHARFDYVVGTDLMAWVPYVRRLRLQVVPFADGALLFETQDRDGTVVDRSEDPDFRSSVGLGLQRNVLGIPGGAGQLRVDFAKRLDRGGDDWIWRVTMTTGR